MQHSLLPTVLLLCIGLFSAGAFSQPVGMVTGSETGTYIKFGRDIAEVAKSKGLDIAVKPSEGSIANIKRLISKENAALAIVQSDALGFVVRSDDPDLQKIAGQLRLVFPFYQEEVHLFARKNLQRFSDLEGKRLVIGTEGSGNWLTANNLLQLTGVKPGATLTMAPEDAIAAVLAGEADAMVYVAGKPVTAFANLDKLKAKPEYAPLLESVHFIALDDPSMTREYLQSTLSTSDYAWFNGNVPTLAVKALLISFDFSGRQDNYSRQRCDQLARLGQALRDNIERLKQTGHPKWKEVNLEEGVGIWKLDTCSRQAPSAAGTGAPSEDVTRKKLKDFLYKK